MNKDHLFKQLFFFWMIMMLVDGCYSLSTEENQDQNQLKINLVSQQYAHAVGLEILGKWLNLNHETKFIHLFEFPLNFDPTQIEELRSIDQDDLIDFSNIYPESKRLEVTVNWIHSVQQLWLTSTEAFRSNQGYVLYLQPTIFLNSERDVSESPFFFYWKTGHLLEGTPPLLVYFGKEKLPFLQRQEGEQELSIYPSTLTQFYDLMNQRCGCHIEQDNPSPFRFQGQSLTLYELTQMRGLSNPEFPLLTPFQPALSLLFLKTLPLYPLRGKSMPPLPHDPLTLEERLSLESWIHFFDLDSL